MILIIDNYDSFVFNIARYFHKLGESTEVIRSDAIGISDLADLKPSAVVISAAHALQRRPEYRLPSSGSSQVSFQFSGFASDISVSRVFSAQVWDVHAVQCTADPHPSRMAVEDCSMESPLHFASAATIPSLSNSRRFVRA